MQEPTEEPLFRVVSGTPTPEELAALTAVLLARTGAFAEPGSAEVVRIVPRGLAHRQLGYLSYLSPSSWQRIA